MWQVGDGPQPRERPTFQGEERGQRDRERERERKNGCRALSSPRFFSSVSLVQHSAAGTPSRVIDFREWAAASPVTGLD